jgi:phospholipid/cholesterol/gamma-HCH transport system permease protein
MSEGAVTERQPDPGMIEGVLGALGAAVLDIVDEVRGIYSVFVRTLYYVWYGRSDRGAVVHQMYEIGNKSLFFICVVMGFFGCIVVFQTGIQAKRVVPDLTMLGAMYLELLVRDLAASIASLMLATRVGAGIAAEIGSMVVTEQVDALRMCAADPIDFLVKPRMLASIIMSTAVIIFGGAVAAGSGALTALSFFDVPPRTFFNLSLVDTGDVIVGLTKCVAYGTAIPVVSSYCGLSTFGGSEGVGWATTRAVVSSSLATIVLNFFISGAAVIIFPA